MNICFSPTRSFSFFRSVFILALLVLAGALSSCIDTYGVRQVEIENDKFEATIEQTKRAIKTLNEEIADLGPKAEKSKAIEGWIEKNLEERSASIRRIQQAEKDLLTKVNILKACELSFRSKSDILPGQTYESITLKSGRKLTKAVVKSVDKNGLHLLHSAGVGVVPLNDLPGELASKITVPPLPMNEDFDANTIFAKKPRALMTNTEYSARLASARDKEKAKHDKASSARKLKFAEEQAERDRASAARTEASEARTKAYDKISAELSKYRDAEDALESKIYDMKERWSEMKLPPSVSDQEKSLGVYETQLRQLRSTISELKTKRDAI